MPTNNGDSFDFQHELTRVRFLARVKAKINAVCASHRVHLFLTLLGCASSFLIMFTGSAQNATTLDTNNAFLHTLQTGRLLHGSSLVSLALITPLFIEGIINLVGRMFHGHDSTSSTKDIHTSCESAIFQFGMMLPLVIPFMPFPLRFYGTAAYCNVRAHYALVMGIFFASMARYDANFVPPRLAIVYYLLIIAANTMAPFQFVNNTTYATSKASMVGTASSVTSDIAIIILICALVRWLIITCYRQMRVVTQPAVAETPESNRAQGELRFRIVYVVGAAFWVFFKIGLILNTSSSSVSSFGDNEWFLFNIPSIMFQLFFWLLSMRMVRFEAVSSLYALIEAKKQYVRYISHELRTPLSVATSGLHLMSIDLTKARQSSRIIADDAETLRDTLDDVTHAITTSVDILNDLLTFDKLQTGIMQLHLTDVNVKSFVEGCCGIFMSQARGDNIQFTVLFADDSVAGSSPITEHDVVRCDKFKVSQVVRNLLSNSLKFTTDSGSVVMRVCFVPEKGGDAGLAVGRLLPSTPASSLRSNMHHYGSASSSVLSRVQSALVSVPRPSASGSQDDARLPMADQVTRMRGALHLSVTDSGAGISQANQARLFKEVVQFNPDVLQGGGGSGLGLYICKSIVDLHGGRIGVASAGEGLGSTFSVVLPMHRDARESTDRTSHDIPLHHTLVLDQTSDRSDIACVSRPHITPVYPANAGRGMSSQIYLFDVEAGRARADDEDADALSASRGASAVSSPGFAETLSATSKVSQDDIPAAGEDGRDGARVEGSVDRPARHDDDGHAIQRSPGRDGRGGDRIVSDEQADEVKTGTEGASSDDLLMQRLLQCLDRGRGLRTQSDSSSPSDLTMEGDLALVGLEDVCVDTAATVLVVEDATANRRVMVKLFKSLGQTVDAAVDGQDAVNKVKKRMALQLPPYDAILMDFKMPIMDGPTATRAIRLLGYTGRIFGVTGSGNVQQFTDSGVERVLMKPFSLPDFQAALVSRPLEGSPGGDCVGVDLEAGGDASPTGERISPLTSNTVPLANKPPTKVRTVLVVEDNTMNRKMLVKLFNSVGQVVEEAVNGQDAVNKVKKRKADGLSDFDAILMDCTMPIMDGPTATRAIRLLGYTGRIFGVTGNGIPTDVKAFRASGVDRVILKPFTLADFQEALGGDAGPTVTVTVTGAGAGAGAGTVSGMKGLDLSM